MKSKIVASMLVTALFVSCLTGCSGSGETAAEGAVQESGEAQSSSSEAGESAEEEEGEESAPSESEVSGEIAPDHFSGTELTIAICAKPQDQSTDFNEKPIMKRMEEETGIHVNWIIVQEAVKSDKLGVMLAADEQPDAYISMLGPQDIVQNRELFYDISEEGLLEKWAPDLYREYTQDWPQVMTALTWADGSIYSLPIGGYASDGPDFGCFPAINTEWLEKLDMDMPANAEELYDYLVAVRDNDMNGNGDAADEIPMTFKQHSWNSDIAFYLQMWGIGGKGYGEMGSAVMYKDNEVTSTWDTENFRSFLEFMNRLYKEGLMDIEGFAQTDEQYSAKLRSDPPVVGVGICFTPEDFGQEEGVYRLFSFQGMEGVAPYFIGGVDKDCLNDWAAFGFVPTADADIEALLHWWNHMGSTEEMKQIARGLEEGINYEVQDGGKVLKYQEQNPDDPDYVDFWTRGFHNNCMPDNPKLTVNDKNYVGGWKERQEYQDIIAEKGWGASGSGTWPYRVAPSEKLEQQNEIEVELKEYMESFFADAIMNGLTDASWEEHLKSLEDYGYYEWIDYWKQYVTGEWN